MISSRVVKIYKKLNRPLRDRIKTGGGVDIETIGYVEFLKLKLLLHLKLSKVKENLSRDTKN